MKTKILFLFTILFLSITSCNTNDDETIICIFPQPFLKVKLIDSTDSSIIITDAEITAVEDDFEELLVLSDSTFTGVLHRPGSYILTITSNNYQTYITDTITRTLDINYSLEPPLEISLTPN